MRRNGNPWSTIGKGSDRALMWHGISWVIWTRWAIRFGPLAEQVLYAGPIQGYKPGTRKGLICVYHMKPPIPVYKVTLDSAERALKSELQSRATEMQNSIRRFGENGAHIVRTE
jgi:hypothetical protein